MNSLNRFDHALNRSLIGFDHLFNDIERIANSAKTSYPPYNIIKYDDNTFEIEIAAAGFDRADINIEVKHNVLTIQGKHPNSTNSSSDKTYLHQGIASRDFNRTFTLADHMVVNEASMTNGIVRVKIKRVVPESHQVRTIPIL